MPFIGVDWGSSSFRAYLLDGNRIVDRVSADDGLKNLNGRSFESVLERHVGRWLDHVEDIFLSGMVTSRTGWVETSYIPCPTRIDGLMEHAVRRSVFGKTLWFFPGLCQLEPAPDVMRGEELQLCGLDAYAGRRFAVLPGTHSKWACLDGETVSGFRTIVTGELYELLLHGSLTGQIAKGEEYCPQAFLKGVEDGAGSAHPITSIFALRAGVLLEELHADAVASRLSGLLIGNEVREAQEIYGTIHVPIVLLGRSGLVGLYQQALTHLGCDVSIADHDTTPRGFLRMASAASNVHELKRLTTIG